MTRFFVRPDQIESQRVLLDAADAHHLRVVLQAKPGDEIAVLDGSGREWVVSLESIGKSRAEGRLGHVWEPQTEPQTQITVAQALPKMAEKIEQVLQHGTEIGVAGFWAFASARSLSHSTGERQTKRLTRWGSIIKTAAEQSHRARMPALQVTGTLQDVLASVPQFDIALLAHPDDAALPLQKAVPPLPRTVLIIVGPESGFTREELAAARAARAKVVTLGPRILRTETAAMVMAAQLLYALETTSVR